MNEGRRGPLPRGLAMKDNASLPYIDTAELRVGMFIHLELGWMSHPFPLSSFRIASAEQIATIRGLGLPRVRWCPEKSEPEPAAEAEAVPQGEPPTPDEAIAAAAAAAADSAGAVTPEVAEAAQQRRRRTALAAQREATQRAERQYAEASKALRQTLDMVGTQPARAREQAQQLTRAMLDKMLVARELNIRLLAEGAGDRASAHGMNVAIVALLMGRSFGLSEADLMDLGVGALLHDMGKLDLPDRIRWRDESFTQSELDYYREHVAHGVAHGRKMGLSAGALLVVAQHHEQADGSGFPLRLNIDRMSAAARIVALVNRFDNLCNPAVPAKALTPHEALSLMFAQGQRQFDTTMLSAFIKMMGVYPPGSAVQLTDDRYALVVSVNSTRPLKPRVLVFDPGTPRDEALLVDLETTPGLGIRRSLKPLALPREAIDYLSPRPRLAYFFEPAAEAGCEERDERDARRERAGLEERAA